MQALYRNARIVLFVLAFCALIASAQAAEEEYVRGGFEVNGYINLAMGWQQFSKAAPTEKAQDGSFSGPLGEFLPNVANGTIPSPGQDNFLFAIQVFELDIEKHFGERARLRADLQFGRAASGTAITCYRPAGSTQPGVCLTIEHAYGEVTINKEHNVKVTVGRFGLQAGFEPYEAYYNDTISWSILWRGLIELGVTTGVQISADFGDHISFYLSGSNSFVNDVIPGFAKIPSVISSVVLSWGPTYRESNFVFSAFGAPEMGNNHDFLIGYDVFLSWWITSTWQLGIESAFQHHQATDTGPATNYIAGLINLHWDVTEELYTVLKYAYAYQSDRGNAVLNLTGAQQFIHEMSVGGAYYVADNAKIKFEWRTDIVNPAVGNTQYVYGFATGMSYAF